MPTNLGKPLISLGLVIFLGLIFIWELPSARAEDQIVRVAVVTDAQAIKLSIRCPYQILALNTNQELYADRRLWRGTIVPTDSGIKINKLDFKIYGIRIQPSRSPGIYLNGRRFRGAVDIIRQADQTLIAINRLSVEEYIRGVLYHEVAPWWPMDALKAQAIVARSFALYQAKVNVHKDYDLVSTIYSQVYGGRTSERGRTTKAVRITDGEVLTYKNKIFPTFYHATCAGHTEAAKRLWKINLPPLRGRECNFCERSPHFRWQKKIALRKIEEALGKKEIKVGLIESIQIVDRDVSGRVTELKISSTTGAVKVKGNQFRLAVGPNIIRSTNFTLEIKKKTAYFTGYGWGHGVGMCQWGAFFMSKKRFNAEQILDYYYTEAKIKKIDQITDAQGNFETF
ncbi:MAG: SpoIID/LytB domain-containing protein [Candidatus Omnitrophica bacterium]|nr:SpoIID/LytB domain-containing protein [Candidatus Omnitrophota bacterium]